MQISIQFEEFVYQKIQIPILTRFEIFAKTCRAMFQSNSKNYFSFKHSNLFFVNNFESEFKLKAVLPIYRQFLLILLFSSFHNF